MFAYHLCLLWYVEMNRPVVCLVEPHCCGERVRRPTREKECSLGCRGYSWEREDM